MLHIHTYYTYIHIHIHACPFLLASISQIMSDELSQQVKRNGLDSVETHPMVANIQGILNCNGYTLAISFN